jgi:hypothetical protein
MLVYLHRLFHSNISASQAHPTCFIPLTRFASIADTKHLCSSSALLEQFGFLLAVGIATGANNLELHPTPDTALSVFAKVNI